MTLANPPRARLSRTAAFVSLITTSLARRLAHERLTELRFSTDEVAARQRHRRPSFAPAPIVWRTEVSRRAIYRFFNQTGAAGIDVVLLSLADFLGTYGDGPPPVEPWNHLLDVCSSAAAGLF